jgi:hypothetical protein
MTTIRSADSADPLRIVRMEADIMRSVQRANARNLGYLPPSNYIQLILDHGREMGPVGKSGPSRSEPNACFANALLLTANRKAVFYCEGYAVPAKVGLPMHHAWCVDQQGRVLDPTWEENSELSPWYYGLTFTREYALRRLKTQSVRGYVGSLLVMSPDGDNGLVTGETPLETALTQWRSEAEISALDPGRPERLDVLEAELDHSLSKG